MIPKLLRCTMAFCVTSSLLATSLLANENESNSSESSSADQGAPPSASSSSSGRYSSENIHMSAKSQRLSQLMGSSVKNAQGETLGQINDFVVNPTSGRVQFVIISLSDPSQSGKMTAVPWTLAKPSADASSVTLNVEKEKLASARTFDATSWPDFSQSSWSRDVYSHYGVQPPPASAQGGGIHLRDSESGSGSSQDSDKKHNPDNGTAPDGRGTFNQGPDVAPRNQVDSKDADSKP